MQRSVFSFLLVALCWRISLSYWGLNSKWMNPAFCLTTTALQHQPRRKQEAAQIVDPPPIAHGIPISDSIKTQYNNMKGDCLLLPIHAFKNSDFLSEYLNKKNAHYSQIDKIIDETLNRTITAPKLDEVLYSLFKLHYHKLDSIKGRKKLNLERFFFSMQDEIKGKSVIPVQEVKHSDVVQSILNAKTMTYREIDDVIDSHVPTELTWDQFLAIKSTLDHMKLGGAVFNSKALHIINKDLSIAQVKALSVTAKPFLDCEPSEEQMTTNIDLILGRGAAEGDQKKRVAPSDVLKFMDLLRYDVFLNYGRNHNQSLSKAAQQRNTEERLQKVEQYRHIFKKHSNGKSISVDAFLASHHLKRVTAGDIHTQSIVTELVKQIHTNWRARIDFDKYVVLSLLIDDNEQVMRGANRRKSQALLSSYEGPTVDSTLPVTSDNEAPSITIHELMKWDTIQEAIVTKLISLKQINSITEMVLGEGWRAADRMNKRQLKMIMGLIQMVIARSLLKE